MPTGHQPDPLRPHSHDPNPRPPSPDPSFLVSLPDSEQKTIAVSDLKALPQTTAAGCYIVSTGHGRSGPFSFSGVSLLDFVRSQLDEAITWSQVEVISADGFGNRVTADELRNPDSAGPILLCYAIDGQPLTRQQGLVRMIVPSEKDDALRQVKWVGQINIR